MSGSIQRRGSRTYRLQVSLGKDPCTGKRVRLSKTVHGTANDAKHELLRLQHCIDTGGLVQPTALTVREYLDDWVRTRERRVTESTAHWYRLVVQKHIEPCLGSVRLQDLTPLTIQQFYNTCLSSGNLADLGASLSPNTVLGIHRVLSTALEEGARLGILNSNPCDRVSPPRPAKRRTGFWQPAEAAAFVRGIREDRLFALYFLALSTGMRRSEILGLRWLDIDFIHSHLTVTQAAVKTPAGVRLKQPKTDRSCRTIALSRRSVEVLMRHRLFMEQERRQLGDRREESDLVFVKIDGTPLSPDYVSGGHFRRLIRRAGVPKVSFHGLRHTHATILAASGVPLKTVSERLGHSSVSTTGDVYGHVYSEMDRRAAQMCDSVLLDAGRG